MGLVVMFSIQEFLNIVICFGISYFLSIIFMPRIIRYSIRKRMFDDGNEKRKVHRRATPRLGGIGIFLAFITSILFLLFQFVIVPNTLQYLMFILSVVLMFILGLVDDLSNLKAKNKFFVQFLVASFLVVNEVIYVDNLHGLFGIHQLNQPIAVLGSILSIIFIINSYNLVDGIDGLSGSLGILSMVMSIVVFYNSGNFTDIYICIPIIGALLGFLGFNRTPASIFMGDSGTMFIGMVLAFVVVKMSQLPIDSQGVKNPMLSVATIFYPVMDTMRVFVNRIVRGKSPFLPDKDHLHHHLLEMRLSHIKSVVVILLLSVLSVFVVYFFREDVTLSFFVLLALSILVSQLVVLLNRYTKRE